MSEFFQEPPALRNGFTAHPWLADYLRWRLPADMRAEIQADLAAFGERCAERLWPLAREAERETPVHFAYDPWGQRVDELRLSPAWRGLRETAAREGLVALPYERKHGEFSRLHQFAKLFLFHPASAFVSCPVAMTDGAARILSAMGEHESHRTALSRLLSRDPAQFWTSGQWMTERTGGSDVSDTGAQAHAQDGAWVLRGTKYFCSAAESEIALALARKPGAPQGSRGLTLFMARPRKPDGSWDGVEVRRLKDKLGTRALATAELELTACPAIQIGADGEGVRNVATLLNITRLHNAICACGEAAQAIMLLEDYSAKRKAFGRPLSEHALHRRLLAQLHAQASAGLLLTLELASLLGREEAGVASAQEKNLLRLMTPVCKIATAKAAVRIASEVVEGFGGAGYIEDVGIARHLRDAQVFPIWEGPSNVLALDMLRVIRHMGGIDPLLSQIEEQAAQTPSPELTRHLSALRATTDALMAAEPERQEAMALDLALHVAALYAATCAWAWASAEPPERRPARMALANALLARIVTAQLWP